MVLEIRGGFDLTAPVTLFGSCLSCDEEYDIAAISRVIQYYFFLYVLSRFNWYNIAIFADFLTLTITSMAFFQGC